MTPRIPAPIEKASARVHRWLYRRTDGRRGGTIGADKRPVALLTTIGRRTGQPRQWPVIYLEDGDDIVIVASNAGHDHHPAWYLNLTAHPACTLQIGGTRHEVTARDATDVESAQLWPRLHALYSGYAAYATRTERRLPIVILEPGRRTSPATVDASSTAGNHRRSSGRDSTAG